MLEETQPDHAVSTAVSATNIPLECVIGRWRWI